MPQFYNAVLAKDTTDCTAPNTGALQVSGGAYVAKQLRISGIARVLDTTDSTSYTNGSFITGGGIGSAGAINTQTSISAGTTITAIGGITGASFTGSGSGLTSIPPGALLVGGSDGQVLAKNGTSWSWLSPTVNPMTTIGDLIVGGTLGAQARLGIGAAGQVLMAGATTPVWASLPSMGSSSLATATLANNTAGALVPGLAFPTSSTSSVRIDFWATRGAANIYCGYLMLAYDGSTPRLFIREDVLIGTMGLTFSVDVSGGDIRVLYTTTSTGTDVAFKYLVNQGAVVGNRVTTRTVAADTTLGLSDGTLYVDTTGGAVTALLPASPVTGLTYNIKKACTSANAMIIGGNGRTIDGESSLSTASTNRPSFTLQYDGATWNLL